MLAVLTAEHHGPSAVTHPEARLPGHLPRCLYDGSELCYQGLPSTHCPMGRGKRQRSVRPDALVLGEKRSSGMIKHLDFHSVKANVGSTSS